MRHATVGPPPGTAEAERRHWRPDIQGLRAIAVVVVIAYHAGLPIPGGFVGVDIFFVISGYVITSMLVRMHRSGGPISLTSFYWRRFARLTPALALMVAATVVASALLQSPFGAQQTTAYTAIGAMLLVANIVITQLTGDYFAAPAESNPLVHTWSLSVEEQFYLVFPTVLLAAWLLGRRIRWGHAGTLAIAVLAIGSFGAMLVGVYVGMGPRTAWLIGFYGPLSRAWEFALGALLVLLPHLSRLAPRPRQAIALLGWLLLIPSLWLINDDTPFPSLWTLLPVGAAAALILGGDSGPSARILGSRPMAVVGDRSYSLYLWHWPLIVLAVVVWPGTPSAPVIAALASVAVAELAYRTVENPFRRFANRPRVLRRSVLVAIVVLPTIAAAVALLMLSTLVLRPAFVAGLWSTPLSGEIGQAEFGRFFGDVDHPCVNVPTPPPAGFNCHESRPGADVDVLLFGDSHAAQLFPAISEQLPKANIVHTDTYGTPIFDGTGERNRWVMDYVRAHPEIKTAIISMAWVFHEVPASDLAKTIAFFKKEGIDVVLVNDTPDFPFDASSCKYRRSVLLPQTCTIAATDRADRRAAVSAVARDAGATEFDAWPLFCDSTQCSMVDDGEMLFRDGNHLSLTGVRRMATALIDAVPSLDALRTAPEGAAVNTS